MPKFIINFFLSAVLRILIFLLCLNKLSLISDENDIYYYQVEEDDDESFFEYLGHKQDMLKKFESIKSEKINNH